MRKFEVNARETEIPSNIRARAAYVGMTMDETWNRGDLTPVETHEFNSEAAARAFLDAQENEYFYNGCGYGRAREWWLESHEEDEDGDIIPGAYEIELCGRGDFPAFKKEWQE